MSQLNGSRKRKLVTRAIPDAQDDNDELGDALLGGILSQSDDEEELGDSDLEDEDGEEEDEESGDGLDDEDELESDEIPSEYGEEDIREQIRNLKTADVDGPNGANGGLTKVSGAELPETTTEPLEEANTEDDTEDLKPNYRVTTDANGNPRYLYREIEPAYDSDDSDAPATTNTIGDIPLSFYDSYPHIGYDINGKKIMRPAKGEALDALLDSIEIPQGWTGLTDPTTGKPLELSREELEVLKKLTRNEVPEEGYDPYPDMVEHFTSKTEIMPLSAAPEPKRRFVPSKHEAKRVMKIVRAIKEGRIKPYRPPEETEDEDPEVKRYDLWADEAPRPDHVMHVPAPKLPPPAHDESYHPPPEYLPDKAERAAWENTDEEDRDKEYLSRDHDALRKVPGYDKFVKEKFERCLDLYLAPRVRRSKLNIDPESLLPKLPSPDELRPFPTACSVVFRGHEGRVRSLAIDPSGEYLATGGDDGTIRLWQLRTGRRTWSVKLAGDEAVNVVRWRPGTEAFVLAAAAGENIFLVSPPRRKTRCRAKLSRRAGRWMGLRSHQRSLRNERASEEGSRCQMDPPRLPARRKGRPHQNNRALNRQSNQLAPPRRVLLNRIPQGQSSAIAIHTLSKHLTQLPFRRLKGLAQSAQFHPSKPIFFVATQRTIRSYDLARQELLKILQPGAKWISSFDVHPGGDNLIVGSYDRRLLWHDLDLSTRPYKTLRYHKKAIRAVRFHQGGLPLFADASDDGSLQIFHGKVVGDLMENATIVPLKVLRGHQVKKELGVLDVDWHPRQPWCVSAGADGTCRLWQ
ncbi:Ribosome biogenesis protein erb1 [Coniosporium tulheliwenetii]|uniref:Ribosome biogenesis protein erb1 n=1 Tax=Coniosporium tulheliwenetii TaxID=3383036 RepID=A0ACC2ZK09_9PEZI|nr:Ribosome biogenesis protein erb1 [Cladosporium sp. JES 115]